jgi:hypothetical protein
MNTHKVVPFWESRMGQQESKIYQTDDYFLSTPSLVYSDHDAILLSRIIRDPHNSQVYWFVTPEESWMGDTKIMRTFNNFFKHNPIICNR